MNGIVKKKESSLLSVMSQLLMILSVILILVFVAQEKPETSFLWVAAAGLSGLATSSVILYRFRSGRIQDKVLMLLLCLFTIGVYLFAIEYLSDMRMFIGLLMSWLIVILLVKE